MSDRLIDRWVSGNASAEDRAELCELIEKDPALADRLFRAAERECDLAEFFRGLPTISTTVPVPTRATSRPRRAASRLAWLPIASGLAAALLMVAVLAVHFAAPRPTELTPLPLAKPLPSLPPAQSTPPTTLVETLPVPLAVDERTTLAEVFADPVNDQAEVPSSKPRAPAAPATTTANKPTPPVMLAANTKPRDPAQAGDGIDRVDGELKDAEGNLVMRYSLRAPRATRASTNQAADLGLLLCFHGAGGNEQWLADPMMKALRSQGEVQMVVAALKSKGPNWTVDDESNVIAFIEWAKRTYPIDPRRIVIQGISNGGWMVSHFGSRHPELVAGVVTLCGGNGFEAPVKRPSNAAETGFEYYVVHGTADEDVNVKNARGITSTLRANGYRYVYRELPGVGHDVWSDEATRRDFAGWLTRIRHKTMPLPEADRKALAAFSSREDAEHLLLSDEGAATLVRIGGLPAEKILVRALRSKNPQVRAAAARLFGQTAGMPGAAKLLAGLLNDKDIGVRASVIASLQRAGDWNDQDALAALCLFAGARNNSAGERLEVVRALTKSIAFRCSPGHDNQLIYELLVHLLDDEDISLRAAAIDTLPPVDPPRFAYDPAATTGERREAVQQWRRWYIDLFAPADDKTDQRR
jgi:dienelactone hydrolase